MVSAAIAFYTSVVDQNNKAAYEFGDHDLVDSHNEQLTAEHGHQGSNTVETWLLRDTVHCIAL